MARPTRNQRAQREPKKVTVVCVRGVGVEGVNYGPGYPSDTVEVTEYWAKEFERRGVAFRPGTPELEEAQEREAARRKAFEERMARARAAMQGKT